MKSNVAPHDSHQRSPKLTEHMHLTNCQIYSHQILGLSRHHSMNMIVENLSLFASSKPTHLWRQRRCQTLWLWEWGLSLYPRFGERYSSVRRRVWTPGTQDLWINHDGAASSQMYSGSHCAFCICMCTETDYIIPVRHKNLSTLHESRHKIVSCRKNSADSGQQKCTVSWSQTSRFKWHCSSMRCVLNSSLSDGGRKLWYPCKDFLSACL